MLYNHVLNPSFHPFNVWADKLLLAAQKQARIVKQLSWGTGVTIRCILNLDARLFTQIVRKVTTDKHENILNVA